MTATADYRIRAPRQTLHVPGLGAWVSRLAAEYPGFDEFDLAGMVEEKTGIPVNREDFELIRSLYLKTRLRAWLPDGE